MMRNKINCDWLL